MSCNLQKRCTNWLAKNPLLLLADSVMLALDGIKVTVVFFSVLLAAIEVGFPSRKVVSFSPS